MSLAAGDVAGAAEALGRPYAVRGTASSAATSVAASLATRPPTRKPTDALTAAPADLGVMPAAAPARHRQTYHGSDQRRDQPDLPGTRERRVESYVFDRADLELYGVEVEVGFRRAAAGMVAFSSVEALVEQMKHDVDRARELLT